MRRPSSTITPASMRRMTLPSTAVALALTIYPRNYENSQRYAASYTLQYAQRAFCRICCDPKRERHPPTRCFPALTRALTVVNACDVMRAHARARARTPRAHHIYTLPQRPRFCVSIMKIDLSSQRADTGIRAPVARSRDSDVGIPLERRGLPGTHYEPILRCNHDIHLYISLFMRNSQPELTVYHHVPCRRATPFLKGGRAAA